MDVRVYRMGVSQATAFLQKRNQEHLLPDFLSFCKEDQDRFVRQIPILDHALYTDGVTSFQPNPNEKLDPLSYSSINSGALSLQNYKCASIILAAGDGSRLDFSKPKALYPITPNLKKTLLQVQLEKIVFLQKQYQIQIPVILLLSRANEQAIIEYLEENKYFSLDKKLIYPLVQPDAIVQYQSKKWMWKEPGSIACAPCGNGGLLLALKSSQCLLELEKMGIEYVQMIPIDNPLANPIDIELISHAKQTKSDLSILGVKRLNSEEKVGVFASCGGKPHIVDYPHMPLDLYEKKEEKSYLFPLANTNIFCFELNWIKKLCEQNILRPYPIEKRMSVFYNGAFQNLPVQKYEAFITDIVPYSTRLSLLEKPRDLIFSPLKNQKGTNSISQVQTAIQSYEHQYRNSSFYLPIDSD